MTVDRPGGAQAFKAAFMGIFRLWICCALFIYVPIEVLYRFDSLFGHLPTAHALTNISVMVVSVFFLALAASFLAGTFVHAGNMATGGRLLPAFMFVNNVLLLAFVADVMLLNLYRLARSYWHFEPLGLRTELIAGIVLVCGIVAFRYRNKLNSEPARISGLFKAAMVIVALAALMVGVRAVQLAPLSGSPEPRGKAGASRPNVILITFDALTAEDMSVYGYHRQTTPNLDSLAARSYVFENMYANYNLTAPSAASILTGKYPTTHGATVNAYIHIPPALRHENIASELKKAGYRTAAVVSNLMAHPVHNQTRRSFDHLRYPYRKFYPGEVAFTGITMALARVECFSSWIEELFWSAQKSLMRHLPKDSALNSETTWPARLTFNEAAEYLKDAEAPFFLWVHVLPPHLPYLPSEGFKNVFLKGDAFESYKEQMRFHEIKFYSPGEQPVIDRLRARYDELLLDADNDFGEFMAQAQLLGRIDDSVVIVSADHGESFTKGYATHGVSSLHQQLIRIPLIIHMPGQAEGTRIKSNAEQVDLAPTILGLAGLPVPAWMEGESLQGAMRGEGPSLKPKFSMFLKRDVRGLITGGTMAAIRGRYKYVHHISGGGGELFDLAADPGETTDISAAKPDVAQELMALLLEKIEEANRGR